MKKHFLRKFITSLAFTAIFLPSIPALAADAGDRQIDINTTALSVSETSSSVLICGSTKIKISDYVDGDQILYNNAEIENGSLFPEQGYFYLNSITPIERSSYTEYLLDTSPVYAVSYSVDSEIGLPIETAYYVSGNSIELPAVSLAPDHEQVRFNGWSDKTGNLISSLEVKEDTVLYAAFSVPGDLRKIAAIKVNPFPNSTSLSDIMDSLPKTATLVLDNGSHGQGQITWSAVGLYDPALTTEQNITFNGDITLPDNITNTTEIEPVVKTTVTIYGAETSTYTLTYDLNGGSGSVPSPSPYEAGDRIALFTSVSKSHSRFLGWSTNPESSYANAGSTSLTMPSHDVILYAVWADNDSYTISFDIGTATPAPPAPVCVYEGEAALLPFNIGSLPDNRIFAGWASSPDAREPEYTSAGVSTLAVSQDITLYAVYEPLKDVSVSYDLNGGQGTSMQDNTIYHAGDAVTVRFIIPSRSNHTFLGWSFQEYAYTADFQADGNTSFTMPNHDVTLYAVWRSDATYTVSYNINGGLGSVPEDNNKYHAGDTVEVLLSPFPEKKNCSFIGWASTPSAAAPSFYKGETSFQIGTSDIELYAVYQEDPYLQIQYDPNGGKNAPVDQKHYHSGDKVLLNFIDLPVYYGHVFLGWAENPDATLPDYSTSSITSFTAVSDSSLKILYAVWDTEAPKHITYDTNGIEVDNAPIDSTNYYNGDTALLDFSLMPKDPQYTFLGWAKTKDAFEPYYTVNDKKSIQIATEDITLYAIFSSSTDIDGSARITFSPGTGRLKALYEPGRKKASEVTFTWMLGDKTLISSSDPAYTPKEAGDYRVLISSGSYTGNIASDPLTLHKITCGNTITLDNAYGLYAKGNTVNAHARITSGSAFKEWTADGISLSAAQKKQNPLSFKMGAENISLSYTATKLYTVKVSGGVADIYSCPEGTTVSLRASNVSGRTFEKWIVSGSVSLSDVTSPQTSFTMPASNVTLSAIFKTQKDTESVSGITSDKERRNILSDIPLIFTVLSDGGMKNADIQVTHHDQGPLCVAVFNLAKDGFILYDDYYNITVQNTAPPIYETDQKILLQIAIPEHLQKTGRVFKMICVSRFGIPFTYEDLDSNDATITIETDRFYAYALCYSDDHQTPDILLPEPQPDVAVSDIYTIEESNIFAAANFSIMRSSNESQTGFLDLDCLGYTSADKSTAMENAVETKVFYCTM